MFGSLVAFHGLQLVTAQRHTARAATYAYVNPVVAVLLGWLLASEPLTLRMMLRCCGNRRLGRTDNDLRSGTCHALRRS